MSSPSTSMESRWPRPSKAPSPMAARGSDFSCREERARTATTDSRASRPRIDAAASFGPKGLMVGQAEHLVDAEDDGWIEVGARGVLEEARTQLAAHGIERGVPELYARDEQLALAHAG